MTSEELKKNTDQELAMVQQDYVNNRTRTIEYLIKTALDVNVDANEKIIRSLQLAWKAPMLSRFIFFVVVITGPTTNNTQQATTITKDN